MKMYMFLWSFMLSWLSMILVCLLVHNFWGLNFAKIVKASVRLQVVVSSYKEDLYLPAVGSDAGGR